MREARHILIDYGDRREAALFETDCFHHTYEARSRSYRVGVVLRTEEPEPTEADRGSVLDFFLGDAQDDTCCGDEAGWLGNGIRLVFDLPGNHFTIHASLSGLPCLFSYESGGRRLYASSVALITAFLAGRVEFDEDGIVDLAVVGYPVNNRTLFKSLSLVGAGSRIVYERGFRRLDHWSPPRPPTIRDRAEYVARARAACDAAITRMDLEDAFLSLTAGLDTRAILALLIKHDKLLPSYTLSGVRRTLDAQRAATLSRYYGIQHRVIHLADEFCGHLLPHCESASLLSGGIASIHQAPELHLYSCIPHALNVRLSGNLGNQIGRSGTEGVRMRCVNGAVFSQRLAGKVAAMRRGHWFDWLEHNGDRGSLRFLVQQENLYASQANYCIGHHHATQKTPYADKTLLTLKTREPWGRFRNRGTLAARMRDLRHRFLGQPLAVSFQRHIVNDAGGAVATVPVNWGWRPRGGIALRENAQGWCALLDMTTAYLGMHRGVAGLLLETLRIRGYSDFHRSDLIHLPMFQDRIWELLSASGLLDSDLFDRQFVTRCLHPARRKHLDTVEKEFLLDIALAWRIFTSRDYLLGALSLGLAPPGRREARSNRQRPAASLS